MGSAQKCHLGWSKDELFFWSVVHSGCFGPCCGQNGDNEHIIADK